MNLPPGYVRREQAGARLVLREPLADALLAAGVADPAGLIARQPATDLRGRARLARLELAEGTFLVRALTRGGLLGKVVRRLSWEEDRAESELRVSAEAAARGAAVPEVVAAVTRPVAGGFHHGLVSRELQGARDGVAILRETSGGARRAALEAAASAVAALHAAGVDHVDLNLKNVLVDGAGRGVVIDLDRCRIGEPSEAVATENLIRLLRSWTKLQTAEPEAVRARDPLRFAVAYAGGDRERLRRIVAAGRAASFSLNKLRWAIFPPRFA